MVTFSEKLMINAQQTVIEKCDVLILAANLQDSKTFQLEKETELIRQRLQQSEIGKRYIIQTKDVTSIQDLSICLLQYEPLILHFSGHGNSDGEIILNDSQGEAQILPVERLAEVIYLLKGRVECVMLSACFSLEKADVLADHVRCVVGMDREIDDESAISFVGGFYQGLALDKGYYCAFELGYQEIKNLDLPSNKIPHFISRDTLILQDEEITPRITHQPVKTKYTRFILQAERKPLPDIYPLWFGTDRKPNNSSNISQGFSGQLDNQLHYGSCEVVVPKSHKIGSTGSSWWQRLKKAQLANDSLKLQSSSLQILQEAVFWNDINQALQEHEPDERSALVFIHGFNVSFEAAALKAAQIGFDLQFPGIMAFYSWASKGRLAGYVEDEDTIISSERYIAEFLLNLATKSEVDKIHIIAHSMGNRGLLRAIDRILIKLQTQNNVSFGQIFLAAPDVNRNVFEDLAIAYTQIAKRTTLYVSSKDKALASSGIIHDRSRVGYNPPITVVKGIDTVDVSDVDLTWLGHGYFADIRTLLEDMNQLLHYNTPPSDRQNRLKPATAGNYWIMRG